MRPNRPDLAALPEGTAEAILELSGVPAAVTAARRDAVTAALKLAVRRSGMWVDRWIFPDAEAIAHGGAPAHPAHVSCTCGARGPACEHILAVLLITRWRDEAWRPLFAMPGWRIALEPVMAAPHPAEAKAPHRGFVRYILRPSDDDSLVPVLRTLVRYARRGDRELTPIGCPSTVERLRQTIDRVTPADAAYHVAERAWLGLLRADPRQERSALNEARQLARASLFDALTGVEHLELDQQPVRAVAEPLRPTLALHHADADGEATLRWTPRLLHRWPELGWALTETLELRRLDDAVPERARAAALKGRPITIPREALPELVSDYVASGRLSVDVRVADDRTADAQSTERRVVLTEEGGSLHVRLELVYTTAEGEVSVEAGSPGDVATIGEQVVARDRAWEDASATALAAHLPRAAPAALEDDDAYAFLAEILPLLRAEGFSLYGDPKLIAARGRGPLAPEVTLGSTDWFDLQVAFSAEEAAVSAKRVLKGWLAGRRWIRLEDGTLARLPTAWLDRHGEALVELEAVRRRGAPVGTPALPLCEALLEEAPASSIRARWRETLSQVRSLERVPERAAPDGMTATLRGYQQHGYAWLAFMRDLRLGACLADDMGLGKTLQALALLCDSHAGGGPPSLVVAPTSVVHGWAREAARFAPKLRVAVHHGAGRDTTALPDADVVVTSYALLRRDQALFVDQRFRHAILDEAQAIRNPSSQVSRVARALRAEHRIALTGTPIQNSLRELYSLFDFLMPGFFGSKRHFTNRWLRPIESSNDGEASAALRARVRPFLLRRLKADVAPELPPREVVVLECELGEAQQALYERVRATYRSSVLGLVEDQGLARARLHVLEALTRLRQAACDPQLLPFPEAKAVNASAKLDLLCELLETAISGGHRTLVFSQWPSLLRRAAARLDARGWGHLTLHGGTRDREGLLDAFRDPAGPPVLFISLKAGGTGLTLTEADTVVHLDPWWNPAAEDQATDRAHRIGQDRPVTVYRLVARGTVEERILDLQERKRGLAAIATDDGGEQPELSLDDLRAVLGAP